MDRQHDIRFFSQTGRQIACHRNNRTAYLTHRVYHVQNLIRGTAVAYQQYNICAIDDAKVAVHRLRGIHEHGRSTGRCKGRGNLVTHDTGLADTHHHNFSAAVVNHFHHLVKVGTDRRT